MKGRMPTWRIVAVQGSQTFIDIIQAPLRINAIKIVKQKAPNARIVEIERI